MEITPPGGVSSGKNPYLYSGKELDRMHGLNQYDFSARWYDSPLGIFTTPDPLAEWYYGESPYVYCSGDPVNRIDPTGMYNYEGIETSCESVEIVGFNARAFLWNAQSRAAADENADPENHKAWSPDGAKKEGESGGVPTMTAKTSHKLEIPGVKLEAYSTASTPGRLKGLEIVLDVKTKKIESYTMGTTLKTSYSKDGVSIGTDRLSIPLNNSGFDISIPFGDNKAVGISVNISGAKFFEAIGVVISDMGSYLSRGYSSPSYNSLPPVYYMFAY